MCARVWGVPHDLALSSDFFFVLFNATVLDGWHPLYMCTRLLTIIEIIHNYFKIGLSYGRAHMCLQTNKLFNCFINSFRSESDPNTYLMYVQFLDMHQSWNCSNTNHINKRFVFSFVYEKKNQPHFYKSIPLVHLCRSMSQKTICASSCLSIKHVRPQDYLLTTISNSWS